jgi:integrase
MRKPLLKPDARGQTGTKLLAAMTGKASPAKAAEGDEPVFAYIASLPQPQRSIAERVDALAANTFAVLLGCELRRAELAAVNVGDLQRREEHLVFADLMGKGGHIRTVPVADWVGSAIQAWLTAATVTAGPMFRAINKAGRVAPAGFSPKVIWSVVTTACRQCGLSGVAPHDLRRTCARLCHDAGGEIE